MSIVPEGFSKAVIRRPSSQGRLGMAQAIAAERKALDRLVAALRRSAHASELTDLANEARRWSSHVQNWAVSISNEERS